MTSKITTTAELAGAELRKEGAAALGLEAGRDQPAERGRQIIAAAFDLLDEEGLEGLTIRAVLKRTGLARRAFYERFSGKDDLVLAVFEQTILVAAALYGEQVKSVADPIKRLELIVTGIVLGKSALDEAAPARSNRHAVAMSREHLRLADSRPEDLQAALRPLINLIADLVADGIERGSVRRCSPQRMAALIYNVVSTTVHTELLTHETDQPDHVRRAELAAEIWEFCRRAIAA